MDTELLFKLLSGIGLLIIGIMARFSKIEGWLPVRKYWLFFVIAGVLSLIYFAYKYL